MPARPRSSTCARRPTTRRSSSSSTRSSPRRSSRAPPTSTSRPTGRELRVRFRVDGVLSDTTTVPRRMVSGVISRMKIMSDLDIAERRVPQDGRVGLTIDGHHVDLRVVTLPSVHGEGVVMRILDKGNVVLDLDALGMAEHERSRFERAIRQSYGAVLVTGPTGSGKSTSLYAALGEINTPEKNIITIEDPVEYQIDGHHAGAGQPEGRADVRHRPALDDARRPRRHHGRRDPRPRDGADRHRGGAHRPPRALDAAHQRRADRRHAPHRDGHRAVPGRQRDRLRRRPAPRAPALPALQAPHDHPRRRAARERLPRDGRPRGLRAGRLPALRRLGLQGPDRPLRGHDRHRRDPPAHRSSARPADEIAARSRCARACAACATTASRRCTPGRTSIAEVARVVGTGSPVAEF